MADQRLQMIEPLAQAYFKLLQRVDWEDLVFVSGLREGLNKFLSNTHLAILRGRNKHHKTHYVTRRALRSLKLRDGEPLIWEHVVPKAAYIQLPCETRAASGALTLQFVRSRLRRYWHLATVTADEDRRLSRLAMPAEWDRADIFARYVEKRISLVPNPYFIELASRGASSVMALRAPPNKAVQPTGFAGG